MNIFNLKNYAIITNYKNTIINKFDNINDIYNGTILGVTKKKLNVKISNSIIFLSKIFIKKIYVQDLRKIFIKNSLLVGKNA